MRRDETMTGPMLRSVATVYGYGPDGRSLGCFSIAIEYPAGTSRRLVEDRLGERCEERIAARWVDGFPGARRSSISIEAEVDHDDVEPEPFGVCDDDGLTEGVDAPWGV